MGTLHHKNVYAGPRGRISWTMGNLLLLAGAYLLLYVGGLYANVAYEQLAARGDNDLVPAAVERIAPSAPNAIAVAAPNAFTVPVLNQGDEGGAAQPVAAQPQEERSTITRVIIPAIDIDYKVIEVGWEYIQEGEQEVAVWTVAKYAVGHHKGSSNPGGGSNIVLAGHVGGDAPVFKDLNLLQPGDQITLYSQGRQYLYSVKETRIVQEVGVPDEQRRANAELIAPTPDEVITLVTCWPPSGPNKFEARVIVRAEPYGRSAVAEDGGSSSWQVR
jgi:sortase A